MNSYFGSNLGFPERDGKNEPTLSSTLQEKKVVDLPPLASLSPSRKQSYFKSSKAIPGNIPTGRTEQNAPNESDQGLPKTLDYGHESRGIGAEKAMRIVASNEARVKLSYERTYWSGVLLCITLFAQVLHVSGYINLFCTSNCSLL
jgi:hypothetical protein